MRAGVRPGLQILRVCLWWTGRFDSDTLPPTSSPRALENQEMMLDESTRAEEVPSQQGNQTAGTARARISATDPTSRKPQAQAPQHKQQELEEDNG